MEHEGRHAMRKSTRREFLRAGAGAASLMLLPPSIRRAMAIPARRITGTIADVQHVVIFTQENRSFDHYFGTLRGVRGFGDRFPIPLPDGRPVWHQRDARGREILPYHFDTATTSAQRVEGTPHTWPDAQEAWNEGRMDRWLPAKSERSLGHYREQDIAFQFALANAFTLCDAYHCAMQTGTNPNRLFLWTGSNDPRGQHGGPALVNTHDDLAPIDQTGYAWTTYPERLEQAGVSWKQYQDMADNFEDNPLEGFRQYRSAAPGSPLHSRALSTHSLDDLARDVREGTLPQVSWIIAPAKYSEHPGPSSPAWGAEYTARVLDALTANAEVWGGTVLLINFDENDGFFDHMPPPSPPSRDAQGRPLGGSTVSLDGEYHLADKGPSHGTEQDPPAYRGRPFGLGPRVPMYVISPWSRGGWVNSQVFDHTSVLRFLEQRFGVVEPNISAWRRAVCGDLTSAFDFAQPERVLPALPALVGIDALVERQSRLPPPLPPLESALPKQAPGVRPSRALPYDLHVDEMPGEQGLRLGFCNRGQVAAVFHVYDRLDPSSPPRRYTVEPGKRLDGVWSLRDGETPAYHLSVHAPNGFYREYRGAMPPTIAIASERDRAGELKVRLHNPSEQVELSIADHYAGDARALRLESGVTDRHWSLDRSGYWYDLAFTRADDPHYLRRLAGRIETGTHGSSDPGSGRAGPDPPPA